MQPSAHKASVNSKRAKRQTANYFEVNSSDVDSPEDYDHMMTDIAFDGGDSELTMMMDFIIQLLKAKQQRNNKFFCFSFYGIEQLSQLISIYF